MVVKIGSARIDEKGNASGGAAGDQTGREVCIEKYYDHPLGWWCIRAKDDAVAIQLAQSMKDACANDCIGYDQSNRNHVITMLQRYGSLKKIIVKTEADCSSLVRACCISCGFDPGNFTTYNEKQKLIDTNRFRTPFKVETPDELYEGDILVTCKKGHTVIVTEAMARISAKPVSSPTTPIAEPKAVWVGKVTTNLLNVRKQPSVLAPKLDSYPQLAKNNLVDVIKELNEWYYVRINGHLGYKHGYVSAKYIAKV